MIDFSSLKYLKKYLKNYPKQNIKPNLPSSLFFSCLLFFKIFLGALLLSNQTIAQQKQRSFRWQLDNGLVILLKENPQIPMVAFHLLVKTGSITEGKYMGSGLSHYFEHMLGKKTKTKKTEEYYQNIRQMGGLDANAYTSYDKTGYIFSIRKQYTLQAIDELADILQNSIFDPKQTQNEIGVILKEMNLRYRDSWFGYLSRQVMSSIYQVHPYRHPIIGYPNLLQKLTQKDILNYYQTQYSPDNMILSIVGDFKIEPVFKKIRKSFSKFQRKYRPQVYIPKEPQQLRMRKLVKRFPISQAKTVFAYPTTNILSKDAPALDALSIILEEGTKSRLHQLLKEKNQLVNSIYVGSWTPKHDRGNFSIGFDLKSQNIPKVKKILMNEIKNIQNNGITDQELKRAKTSFKIYEANSKLTLVSQARWLAYGEFLGDMFFFEKETTQRYQKLNKQDIQNVAIKYFKNHSLNWITLLPKQELITQNPQTNNTPKQPHISQNPEEKIQKSNNIQKIVLDNGIKLILKMDKTTPLIVINARFQGGYSYENPKNQGIHDFLSRAFLSGTKTKTDQQISEMLADLGGNIASRSDSELFSVQASFLKENFQKGFKLYMEILSDNTFPEKKINHLKQDVFAKIKQRKDNIHLTSYLHLKKLRFKNHPYSYDKIGTLDSLKNVDQQSLHDLYENIITPDNLVLSIVGDFDENDKNWLIQFLNQQSNPKHDFFQRKAQNLELLELEPINQILQETHHVQQNKKQTIIRLLFDGPKNRYHPDNYPLLLLGPIFSGIGSRLFNAVRGEGQNIAYSSSASHGFADLSITFFQFQITTVPDKKSDALNILFDQIKKIKNELVSQKELDTAKNSAITYIIKELENIYLQSSAYSQREALGLGYDHHIKLIDQIKKLNPYDIQQAAIKYFNLDQYTLSIVEEQKN